MTTTITDADHVIRCCPRCGADLPAAAETCPTCGAAIRAELTPASINAAPAATAASTEQLLYAQASAMRQLQSKEPPDHIITQLAAQSLDRATATALVNTLIVTRYQVERSAAKRTMIDGVLWALGGIVVTIITLLIAQERGGTYFIVWGPALFGGLQFFRSLSQYLRSREPQSLVGTLTADPAMLARGLGWPAPVLNLKARLGSFAILGLFVMLTLLGRGDPLIDKPAAQLNLTAAEVGADFSITQEHGPQAADSKDVRDSNTRDLESNGVFVRSMVLVGRLKYSDTPAELIDSLELAMQKDSPVAASFEQLRTVSIGDRGGIEPFTVAGDSGPLQGYVLVFIRRNVIVMLIEIGPKEQVTEDTVQKHARLINSRLQ
jgi:hypothetical protein